MVNVRCDRRNPHAPPAPLFAHRRRATPHRRCAECPVLASGADCGDGVAPCHCGDTVITPTRLDASDPILRTTCPCDGLRVVGGVPLEIGGTIRGSGACLGLNIVSKVAVGSGRVTGFDIGVRGFEASDTRIHDIQVSGNIRHGIQLDGDRNLVENCIVSKNGGSGILITGERSETANDNEVRRCRIEDNREHGIRIAFNRNLVENNFVRGNAGTGIVVDGDGNEVSLNRVESNRVGISVGSDVFLGVFDHNVISRNLILRNVLSCLIIEGDGAIVDSNRCKYNGAAGFVVEGESHGDPQHRRAERTDGFTVFATTAPSRATAVTATSVLASLTPASGIPTSTTAARATLSATPTLRDCATDASRVGTHLSPVRGCDSTRRAVGPSRRPGTRL